MRRKKDRRKVAGPSVADRVLKKPLRIMNPLPSSSKTVLKILGTEGAMTHKDIVSKSHCSPRTIRYALRKLKEKKLLIEKMNMRDMRQIIYQYRAIPPQENEAAQS
jgi:predicted transcriptional regulator